MSSAARSASGTPRTTGAGRATGTDPLSGPVAVCVDRPILPLDRSFTYELPAELGAGVGSLVQVPFHGALVRGWVLGPTEDLPERIATVKRTVSPVRFFDPAMLEVLRWVSERYIAPLAAVIARSHPPRVASEESAVDERGAGQLGGRVAPAGRLARPGAPEPRGSAPPRRLRDAYANGPRLSDALHGGAGAFVLRPAPVDEVVVAVECVAEVLASGRSAVVLVPEVDPLPETAAAVLDAAGEDGVLFAGGDRRVRFRTWLDIARGRYRVVVGTRPAVFAPVRDLGLVYVARESHALHREERAPYYHVRDVALARGRLGGGAVVMEALFPSLEALAGGHVQVSPRRRAWPPVEIVAPGPEGRAPRLVAALRSARRAFIYSPLPGYGVARVCRSCGEPAMCSACGGTLRAQDRQVRCVVCGAAGICRWCGASDFGIARGGAERVEEWTRAVTSVPVTRIGTADRPRGPLEAEVLVGGVEAVKDFGPVGVDLVAILDADLAARRPGLSARERAVATWFEAAAWAGARGRVIVQTRTPNDPAVQALVAGRPERFARSETERRAQAGFPVGGPVFRVSGTVDLEDELRALGPRTLLTSKVGGETVCLVALDPGPVGRFGTRVRELAERGVVIRVEAEPHL